MPTMATWAGRLVVAVDAVRVDPQESVVHVRGSTALSRSAGHQKWCPKIFATPKAFDMPTRKNQTTPNAGIKPRMFPDSTSE